MKILQKKTQKMVQMQGSPLPLVGQFDQIIVGEYQLFKYKPPNNFHYVNITTAPRANLYIWRARNGASWNLGLISSEKVEEDRVTCKVWRNKRSGAIKS